MKFNRLTIALFVLLAAVVLGWHDFLLWLSGLDHVRAPDIAFTAVYDFTPAGKSLPPEERTVHCDGQGMLSLTGKKFHLIEDYPPKRKFLVQPEQKSYYEIEFLQQTPSVHFFQHAYLQLWDTVPLGRKSIDGVECNGFQQNGVHKHTPLESFFKAIGMRLEAVPGKDDPMKEFYQLWYDNNGILVQGYGMRRKSLALGQPSADDFVVPADFHKLWLP